MSEQNLLIFAFIIWVKTFLSEFLTYDIIAPKILNAEGKKQYYFQFFF